MKRLDVPVSKKQYDIIFSPKEITIAYCGRSFGKTEAIIRRICYRALAMHRTSLAIEPTYRLLSENLFPKIISTLDQWNASYKVNNSSHKITINDSNNTRILGVSGTSDDKVRSYSDIEDLYVDEAAYVSKSLYRNAVACCRSSRGLPTSITLTSTPRYGSWFNNLILNKDKYKSIRVIQATYKDNPFTTNQFKRLLEETFEDTPEIKDQELYASLDSVDNSSIFKPKYFSNVKPKYNYEPLYIGIDFAGDGSDKTKVYLSSDYLTIQRHTFSNEEQSNIYSYVSSLYDTYGDNIKYINGDSTGGFSQAFEQINKTSNKYHFNKINFQQEPHNPRFTNTRAELYFNLLDKIKTNHFYVEESIREELALVKYFINNQGKIQLFPKKEIKLALGHSPDDSDALALSTYRTSNKTINVAPIVPTRFT